MDRSVLSKIKSQLHKPESFTVLQYRFLRPGTVFLPIEKSGKSVYFNKRGRLLKERLWKKGDELFVKDSNARAYNDSGEAIFALTDWCVVRVLN